MQPGFWELDVLAVAITVDLAGDLLVAVNPEVVIGEVFFDLIPLASDVAYNVGAKVDLEPVNGGKNTTAARALDFRIVTNHNKNASFSSH